MSGGRYPETLRTDGAMCKVVLNDSVHDNVSKSVTGTESSAACDSTGSFILVLYTPPPPACRLALGASGKTVCGKHQ